MQRLHPISGLSEMWGVQDGLSKSLQNGPASTSIYRQNHTNQQTTKQAKRADTSMARSSVPACHPASEGTGALRWGVLGGRGHVAPVGTLRGGCVAVQCVTSPSFAWNVLGAFGPH